MVTFDPPKNVGGIEGRANNYSQQLVGLGHFVEVISLSSQGDYSSSDLHGALLINYPSSSKKSLSTIRKTTKEISQRSIDAIFLLSGGLTIYGILLLLYARWKGVQSVALFYGKDILSSKKRFTESIALKLAPWLAKKILANSRYTASLLPSRYSRKIEILYPSVDPHIADDIPKTNNQGATILFVGRLVKRKGVDDLIYALNIIQKKVPDAMLEIVGDGPEAENLQKLATDQGVKSSVRFFGKLTGAELYQRYANCNAFTMPSKTTSDDVEGFGTVFLEAAAFGKPSVGTMSGGIPEAIKDGVTGLLVPEGDVQSLAQSIAKLLVDSDFAKELGSNAKKDAISEFTWEKATKRLEGILRR